VAVVALFGSAMIGGTAQAKKKKKPATVQNNTPRPIPDAVFGTTNATPPATTGTVLDGSLATPLNVSKKFKGTVGRVAVTIATTPLSGTNPAADLDFRVTAPDGTTVGLREGWNGLSIGPLTIQPNSKFGICSGAVAPATAPPPPCSDPDSTVFPPYVGTIGNAGLNLLNGSKMKGTWNVTAFDRGSTDPAAPPPANVPQTSTLNSVKLVITPQKPVK